MYIHLTNEYLVGKIFYKQDFTFLRMINQFLMRHIFSYNPVSRKKDIYLDIFEQFG